MKVLYITYENLYKTAILQAMVVKPLDLMLKKYKVDFTITSSMKSFENDDIYISNKKYVQENTTLSVKEFEKNLTSKQSILRYVKDIIPMIRYSIAQAKKSDMIHCRSYGGAMIGLVASVFSGKPFIFDMRGVLPEETVDVGKISKSSLKFKLMKFVEKILINKSAYVFTVSEKFNNYIQNDFKKKNSININNPTDFSQYYKDKRDDGKINFIYSGSMQVWHLPELTIEYFAKIQKIYGEKVYLYFCTNDIGKAESIFQKFDVPNSSYEINTVPFEKMPEYYSKADIAFCLIKESFSKSVCFPVKFSEYIASNLYVIGNRNIGDIERIIEDYNCGIVLDDINDIDSNTKELSSVIDKILDDKYIDYNRNNLSFLDWNEEGIEKIYSVYLEILEGAKK
jgi:glycosyltransferase involved in cell wall biosynthesis